MPFFTFTAQTPHLCQEKEIEPQTQPQHQHPGPNTTQEAQDRKKRQEFKKLPPPLDLVFFSSHFNFPLSILFSFQVLLTLLTTSICFVAGNH